MQSSSTVTLRAMVMLICLVAVPLVAVSGTSLPKLLTDAIKGRKPSQPATAPAHGVGAAKGGGEAPPFSPTVRLPEHEVAIAADPRAAPMADRRAAEIPASLPRLAPAVAAAPLWGPGDPSAPTTATLATGQSRQNAEAQTRDSVGVSGASHRGPPPATQPPLPTTRNQQAIGHVTPIARTETGERFTQIQTRLRDLGASYYLLETWGNRGDQFRFHCKVANSAESFEATDRDPLVAMQKVLERVEASRGGR